MVVVEGGVGRDVVTAADVLLMALKGLIDLFMFLVPYKTAHTCSSNALVTTAAAVVVVVVVVWYY